MIKRLGVIIILCLLMGGQVEVLAQQFVPTPVEISTEKVNIKGNIFYVHRVLAGQTLYSVGKVYNVPIEELIKHNPTLKDGLKAGSFLYIPTFTPQEEKKVVETPVSQEITVTPDTPDQKSDRYKKHTVKWYENIYDVATRYDVPVEAIISLNELGENTVLKKRQVLYIPDKEYVAEFKKGLKEISSTPKKDLAITVTDITESTDSMAVAISEPDSIPELIAVSDTTDFLDIYKSHSDRSYKISLILPFGTKLGADKASPNLMDFYSGAIIALYDFREKSGENKFTLNVVDISDYPTIFNLLESGILDDSELIVGPLFEKDIVHVAEWAKERHIPIVSPLDPKAASLVKDNPFLFQYPPAQEPLVDQTYQGVINECTANGTRPLIIYERWTGKSNMVTSAIKKIEESNITPDTLAYGILEGRGIDAAMLSKMDTTSTNTVFVVSESEAFVSDVMRNLLLVKGQMPQEGKISLYGYPKWKNFETIELSYFHDLNTHISIQYNIDYNSQETKDFVTRFTENFEIDPNQYAFQGYDVLTYFLNALNEYGREFPAFIQLYEKSLLQSNLRFEKGSPQSGFTNNGIRNILYFDNWEIKPW